MFFSKLFNRGKLLKLFICIFVIIFPSISLYKYFFLILGPNSNGDKNICKYLSSFIFIWIIIFQIKREKPNNLSHMLPKYIIS